METFDNYREITHLGDTEVLFFSKTDKTFAIKERAPDAYKFYLSVKEINFLINFFSEWDRNKYNSDQNFKFGKLLIKYSQEYEHFSLNGGVLDNCIIKKDSHNNFVGRDIEKVLTLEEIEYFSIFKEKIMPFLITEKLINF